MQVRKRNSVLEDYNVEKIHKVLEWATEGINGVSVSDIEMNAELSLRDGISSKEIHQILIKSANDLISESSPNYQYVAARLLNMSLRKDVWGHASTPPQLLHHIEINVDNGIYDPRILEKWDAASINKMAGFMNHKRDDLYTYAGLQQMVDKYLVKNRMTGQVFETPQYAYLIIAMCLSDTIQEVKDAYDCYSTFKINLPTPIMAGVRTIKRQFASCVLVDVDDDLDGIFSSVHAVGKYTANRAGIGLNTGRIRPINSPIRGGEVIHTGLIPYLKCFETAVKSTTQNGLRGGSATVHIPFWHYEIEDVMVLKNNAGTDDNRVRKLDYSVQFCKLFYERLVANEDITLFSPHEAKGLYEAFGDNEKFEELYKKYENARSLQFKKKIPARKLAEIFARERLETGRIYSMNIDNANENGSWNVPVYMSNLCQEIIHPTKPISSISDEEGEIGICILSALNLLELNSDEDIQVACRQAVRSLESVIDYQDYPVKAAENFTKNRRSLGIGITNFAGYMAKNKLLYSDPDALQHVHDVMEKIQWNLINESCNLAKELGPCAKFSETKYADGLLPIDWYKKEVDKLVKPKYNMDWEGLRKRIKEYGLRHSTLSAIMPCESSSVIQNSTNGIEPVRNLLSFKKAKNGVLKQVVPNYHNRKNFYTKAWDIQSNKDIISIAAVIQKFVDMSMSTNLYYNYNHYEDGNIPLSVLIKDQILGYKYGLKNFYYANTPDGDGETEKEMNCDSGACAI
ncbi:MAG: ribonucleoside-diphosphate reductase subunit alpha [Crocinitomicaceae bacterium]|nr:ribonucleoside-diphosphate reductase subunit alpha [Crocinitomicaceae bacterium]